MAEELVGKGCECIFPYEKHYIELLFSERIEEEKKKLLEVQDILSKMPPESRDRYEGARDGFKFFIHDLEIVRERFKAMPDCEKEQDWTYVKVGTTEVRGRRVPTGLEIRQVSPTYDQRDFDKAVKLIEEKLKE